MMSPGVETWYKYTLTNCTQIKKNHAVRGREWVLVTFTKQEDTYRWTIPHKKTERLTGRIGKKSKCSRRSACLTYIYDFIYDSSFSLSFLPLFSFTVFPCLIYICVSLHHHFASRWISFTFLQQSKDLHFSLTDYWLYVSLCVNPVIVNPNSPKESQIPFKLIWAQVLHLREKQVLFGYMSRKCSHWIIFMLFSDHYLIKLTISEWKTFQYFSNLI